MQSLLRPRASVAASSWSAAPMAARARHITSLTQLLIRETGYADCAAH